VEKPVVGAEGDHLAPFAHGPRKGQVVHVPVEEIEVVGAGLKMMSLLLRISPKRHVTLVELSPQGNARGPRPPVGAVRADNPVDVVRGERFKLARMASSRLNDRRDARLKVIKKGLKGEGSASRLAL
jgi:hypothetical protein